MICRPPVCPPQKERPLGTRCLGLGGGGQEKRKEMTPKGTPELKDDLRCMEDIWKTSRHLTPPSGPVPFPLGKPLAGADPLAGMIRRVHCEVDWMGDVCQMGRMEVYKLHRLV